MPPIGVLLGDPKYLANTPHRFNPKLGGISRGIISEGKTMVVNYDNLMPISPVKGRDGYLDKVP